jgi:tetratricopeptide (TPR) repeat protein
MKSKLMTKRIRIIILIITVLLSGCISDEENIILPPVDPYYVKVADGWINFKLGDYQNGIIHFKDAMDDDPSLSAAYLGLGWCYAMIDDFQSSLPNFDVTISIEPDSPDAYAAKSFIYLAQNEYESAVKPAEQAILLGGEDYVFSQIPDVGTRNLRLLMAESHYALGQYKDAQTQINILEPDNGLDQNSRNYKRELILKIESLKYAGTVLKELNS